MPSTDKTSKLGLNQFIDTDKPNWTDYTEDMAKIDGGTLDKNTYDPTSVGGDAFRASNQKMTGYVKSSEYTAITPSDNASSAIGKLEAGVAATGDMKKAVYDADNDGKVDNAKVADEAKSVKYAAVIDAPVALPNPNALTIQLDGVTKATYTGGAEAAVNVTASSIGAASLVGGKVPSSQLDIVDATDSTEKTKVASANSVRMAKEEAVAAIPETYDAVNITQSAIAGADGKPISVNGALGSLNLNIQHPPKFASGNFGGSDIDSFILVGALLARKSGKIWNIEYSFEVAENTIATSNYYGFGIDVRKVGAALGFTPSLTVSGTSWRGTLALYDANGVFNGFGYSWYMERQAIRPAYLNPGRVYDTSGSVGAMPSSAFPSGYQFVGTFYLEEA